jgi:uncharacterized membrane protein
MPAGFYRLIDRLRSSYWFIPSVMALGAAALSLVVAQIDYSSAQKPLRFERWIYTGGPEGARHVLSTIAGSTITVAGTTFSITVAALSLASAQFGPRLLRNFMRDTGNQVVLGTFTSTFLYCILVLRTIRGLDDNTYVPHVSVTVGVILALGSVGVLIYFIHHVAESIQVSHVIEVVGAELDGAISRLFPEKLGKPADDTEVPAETPDGVPVFGKHHGYVQAVDDGALLALARKYDAIVTVVLRPGDYSLPGTPVVRTSGPLPPEAEQAMVSVFSFGRTRTSHQDAVFAFLQLAEVAVRALSPGVNDPFTAMMCIDRITSGMCALASRELPQAIRCDEDGAVRVIARPYSYSELVEAAYRHIREAAAPHWQVKRRLAERIETVWQRADDPLLRAALKKELDSIA